MKESWEFIAALLVLAVLGWLLLKRQPPYLVRYVFNEPFFTKITSEQRQRLVRLASAANNHDRQTLLPLLEALGRIGEVESITMYDFRDDFMTVLESARVPGLQLTESTVMLVAQLADFADFCLRHAATFSHLAESLGDGARSQIPDEYLPSPTTLQTLAEIAALQQS